MLIKKIILILFILSTHSLFAQKVSQNEVMLVTKNFLSNSKQTELIKYKPETILVTSKKTGDNLFYILNYKNAFLIVSANKKHIPIKAFSFKNKFIFNNKNTKQNMLNILINDYENFNLFLNKNRKYIALNNNKWKKQLLPYNKNINDEVIGPLLSSEYGQLKPKDANGNYITVTNYFTPNHYSVGCVAITLTELLQYYEWPRKGTGSYSYTDNYGSSTGTYSVNFEEKYNNWSLILDKYKDVESNESQRKELGRLAFHAATSINMDYEYNGSTSNINRIPNAAKNYFRYISEYKTKSESDFWEILDANLHQGIPAQFAIYTSSGAGHAVVGDGIKYVGDEKYYHLNMGWWGNVNAWYQIHQSFNAGGYTNITAAVLNMIPIPELDTKPKIDFENKTASLKWYYTEKIPAQNFELQIKKGVADWETLTDTFTTSFSYIFKADSNDKDYTFRIRAKVHDTWYDNSWSNSIKIKQTDFIPKGKEELTLLPSLVLNNKLKVSYNNLKGSTIKIFDLKGEVIFQTNERIQTEEYNIDVSNLQTGIYILQVINTDEKVTSKFFKQ